MNINEFAETYGVTVHAIYTSRHKDLVYKNGVVDIKLIQELNNERDRIVEFNHEVYYWMSEFWNDYEIAYIFEYLGLMTQDNCYAFLRYGMFLGNYNRSILDFTLSNNHKIFNYFARVFRGWVSNKVRIDIDVGKILDLRSKNES